MEEHRFPRKIEDYPNGYPRLATFIDADPGFGIVRRFGNLYARNILLKQDRLADLEAQLDELDTQEEVRLYLSSRRKDGNQQRVYVLDQIDEALSQYESAISSYQYMTSLSKPSEMNKRSMIYWMQGNKPLVKRESEYLNHEDDLVGLAIGNDRGKFDEMVEWAFYKYLPTRVGKMLFTSKTTKARTEDGNVRLYTPNWVQCFSRLVISLVVVSLLLIPMIVLYNLRTDLARFLAIVFSTIAFAAILTTVTNARKAEIFTATAAYCAVLVVYVGRVV